MRRIRIMPRAEAHLNEARAWYEAKVEGLGERFLDEVKALLDRVAEHPGSCPVHRGEIRRGIPRRFPYLVFYVPTEDEVVVIAVLHAHRNPKSWPKAP